MPFADLPGVRLHYRFDGDAGAPVLVLSNSLGTDLEMWAPQLDKLARQCRVLRRRRSTHRPVLKEALALLPKP